MVKEVKMDSTQETQLEDILRNLDTDKNRIAFLKKIYSPGNIEIVNKILSIDPKNTTVLEMEINYARENKLENRFITLAKKLLDYYIDEDKVIKWDNKDIAEYVLAGLASESNEHSLEAGARIAAALGKEAEARQYLEKLLKIQIKQARRHGYFNSPANTCIKLGKYDEAINFYLKSDYYIDKALKVAKEHSPESVAKIAKKGFNESYPFKEELYVECARILGKTDQAKEALSKYAKKLKPDNPPRVYRRLVKSLIKLNLEELAKDVVHKIEKNEFTSREKEGYWNEDREEDLALLFHEIGEDSEVKDIYLARIENRLEKGWGSSHISSDIKQAYELTKDKIFLEKKLELLEQTQEYGQAEELAAKLGKQELVTTYHRMQEMIAKAEAETKHFSSQSKKF